MAPSRVLPAKPRQSATLWRLVDVKCAQIAEAITAARLPFLLSLTWSFIWLSALYGEHSYVHDYGRRLMHFNALMHPIDKPPSPAFAATCRGLFFGNEDLSKDDEFILRGDKYVYDKAWQIEFCRKYFSARYKDVEKARFDSTLVSLPWGMGRLNVTDFGIVGNVALVLILSWGFFAARRENQALKSFVNFHPFTSPRGFFVPDTFILCPSDAKHFSAEHFAYAYQSVSQRFMFLSADHPRFFSGGALIVCIPAGTALLNAWSNYASFVRYPGWFEQAVYTRFKLEVALALIVVFLTGKIVAMLWNTLILLNGWSLAVRHVWMGDWNEATDDPAAFVVVTTSRQVAVKVWRPMSIFRDQLPILRGLKRRHRLMRVFGSIGSCWRLPIRR